MHTLIKSMLFSWIIFTRLPTCIMNWKGRIRKLLVHDFQSNELIKWTNHKPNVMIKYNKYCIWEELTPMTNSYFKYSYFSFFLSGGRWVFFAYWNVSMVNAYCSISTKSLKESSIKLFRQTFVLASKKMLLPTNQLQLPIKRCNFEKWFRRLNVDFTPKKTYSRAENALGCRMWNTQDSSQWLECKYLQKDGKEKNLWRSRCCVIVIEKQDVLPKAVFNVSIEKWWGG